MKVPHHLQKIQGKEAQAMTQWQIDRMQEEDWIEELLTQHFREAIKRLNNTMQKEKPEKRNSTQTPSHREDR